MTDKARGADREQYLSRPLLERVARYYQIVTRAGEEGQDTISSAFLGQLLGIDATLVRKDMAAAGITGRPKVGYAIREVISRLDEVLGLTERNDAILIGCGNLGSAIAQYSGFSRYGLELTGLFDIDHASVGRRIGSHVVLPMEKCKAFIEIFRIQIAIVTAPASAAQSIADWLVEQKIRAIWNFAPVHLRVPSSVILRNENLAIGLSQLIHLLKVAKSHGSDFQLPESYVGEPGFDPNQTW